MTAPVPNAVVATATQPATNTTTVREAVFDLMRRFGMTSVFANPGSTELPMFRDFPSDFRYILGLQEACVVGMADGYAQATRNASFVNLHSAAGVGNAMGNIFTAYKNRTPMVITAGQQARSILPFDPFLSSAQATELPKPYVKWSIEPARAQDVPLAIARAYYLAMMPPCGPVLVSVPVDDWDQYADLVPTRVVSTRTRAEPELIARISAALEASERPAFVVGAAADRDGAWKSSHLRRLTTRVCGSLRCRDAAASRKTIACSPVSFRHCASASSNCSRATISSWPLARRHSLITSKAPDLMCLSAQPSAS
jgi:benzoylformate decarboxylase